MRTRSLGGVGAGMDSWVPEADQGGFQGQTFKMLEEVSGRLQSKGNVSNEDF